MTNVATFDFVKHQYTNQANRKVSFRYIFSCASAKAERSLSSLYGVFLCVELGDPPPDFMGLNQNTTPLLYDSKFAMTEKTLPQLNRHGCIW